MTTIELVNDKLLKENYNQLFKKMMIIDIREPTEYAREHIPGSLNIPLTKLKEADFSEKKDQMALFTCRLGARTLSAQDSLLATGLREIYCLEGGIEQWKRCGLPIEINRRVPIDVMRQVQIVSGLLILIGIILAYNVASYFIWLTVFVGLGLLTAGITGFCGMAKLLLYFPWNKTKIFSENQTDNNGR